MDLLEPADVEQAIESAIVPLAPFFNMDAEIAKKIRAQLKKIAREVGNDPRQDAGELGGCWLWLMDNTDPLTRALLLAPDKERRVAVSRLGHEFGARATYYSVLNSDDPDGLPSYTDDFDDIHMNEAHEEGRLLDPTQRHNQGF